MNSGNTPPSAELIAGSQTISGELGSYVWGGRAVDSLLTLPAESAVVRAGEELRFIGEGDTPAETTLTIFPATTATTAPKPLLQEELASAVPRWQVRLAPGEYLLALFRAWPERNDTTHYFRLQVRPTE